MEKLEILVAPEKSNFVKTKPLRPARVPQGGRRLFELVVHHQVMVCEGGRCASAAGPSPGRGRRTKKNQTPSSWQIPAPASAGLLSTEIRLRPTAVLAGDREHHPCLACPATGKRSLLSSGLSRADTKTS